MPKLTKNEWRLIKINKNLEPSTVRGFRIGRWGQDELKILG